LTLKTGRILKCAFFSSGSVSSDEQLTEPVFIKEFLKTVMPLLSMTWAFVSLVLAVNVV
jgi:hypothetical protein